MSAQNFHDLSIHYGHNLVLAQYTDSIGEPISFAVECEDCGDSLLDYEREGGK
jgi:hypothetical protein